MLTAVIKNGSPNDFLSSCHADNPKRTCGQLFPHRNIFSLTSVSKRTHFHQILEFWNLLYTLIKIGEFLISTHVELVYSVQLVCTEFFYGCQISICILIKQLGVDFAFLFFMISTWQHGSCKSYRKP